NDAMAHRGQPPDFRARARPIEQECERAVVTGWLAFGPRVLVERLARRVDGAEPGAAQELLEVPGDHPRERGAVDVEDRELKARRAGVEYEDCVGHSASATRAGRAANARAIP